MGSCATCNNLVPLPGPSGGFISGGYGIDLANSASGCLTCSILWEGLSALCVQNPHGVQWIALKQVEDAFRLQYRHSAEDRIWLGLHFYTRDGGYVCPSELLMANNLMTVGCPLSDIFKPSRDLEVDTACNSYLTQAQGWVRDCCEKHDHCKERLSTTLPTRVLDVSRQGDLVFLCEPEKTETGSYLALSHVWGGEVPIRTTTQSLSTFKNGIRLQDLPQTFRDAVFMTRFLDCPYLWIDSLCIIQDSREDWKREAARMADVYGNSYVTIAAVMSANSKGGLFSKHEAADVKHTITRVGEGGRDIIIDVRLALEHSSYYESSAYGLPPGTGAWLLGRAWCYQEYLLSPRVLLFTDWEILWVCLARRECNCGQYSKDTRDIVSESDLKIRFERSLRGSSFNELHGVWRDIVRPYSSKEITFATDKLPALAGIAHLFSGKGLNRYVNGLWESTLIPDLFWEISSSFMDYYHIMGRRSTDPSMPSWTWASVDAPVDMYPIGMIEGLEVVEIAFEPERSGSLAEVSAKTLTLRGIFFKARVWCNPRPRLIANGMNEASWLLDVTTEVDCGPDDPRDGYVLCGIDGPGLVLTLVKGMSDTYKRLGKIGVLPKDRSHFATKTVRLV
ncbi:HET-domain-containing protein [Xylariaceae sp. FL1651]|nr:HET-domain-containing protein [Xylariaceae sp. FL1651]